MPAAAGIVLAGGRSRRMGTSKAALEWHGSTLLRRTTGVLSRVVDGPVLVVRAPGGELPPLPETVQVVDDPVEDRGPLQGMAVGLAAAGEAGAATAFICSTDLPFLHPAFVRRVLRALGDHTDAVVPHPFGVRQPLAAAYRTALAPLCAQLVAAGRPRPAFLLEACRVVFVDEVQLLADAALAAADPALLSLTNLNEPADYRAAREEPGPEVEVECFGVLARAGGRGVASVRAATLGDVAAAVDLPLDRHVLAALNGDQTVRDPETPVVQGDRITFMSADAGG
jgi:molybdopterin-guanine dinucleotide biosynthesis protein A